MMNRIIEKYSTEMELIRSQAEQLLEKTKAERRYTALEYITLLSLTELVEILRMDMGSSRFLSRAKEFADGRNRYQLPLLDTEEYILIRNLLENRHGTWEGRTGEHDRLLDKIRRETKTVIKPDGAALMTGSPSESVFRQYYDDILRGEGK